jgi:sterol desaturase/sphingolipid hydroxylase (fatty acid hydroxylase superfamily)
MRPRANHGVTTSLWDHVFRTYVPVERVRVPRRSLAALPWLAAAREAGAAPPAFAADYEVV